MPADRLGQPPYNRCCQVETPVAAGSGWLYAKGQILTAAHVVAGAASIRVRFAGQTDWINVTIGKIADGYYAPNGTERQCSPSDVAMLLPLVELAIGVEAFSPIGGGLCVAVGFADGVLVEHAATGLDVGPFIAHNCHTDHGHSGCPVFVGNTEYGIHVGLFNGSRVYLTPPQSQIKGYLNSAVRLDTTLTDAFRHIP